MNSINNIKLTISVMDEIFGVCQLEKYADIPSWATADGNFFSITKTNDELSIVCLQKNIPHGLKVERDFKCFKIEGPLDFSLTGILSSLAKVMAEAKISIFAISTYDTDYILVRSSNVEKAIRVIVESGHTVKGVTGKLHIV